jgi:hypothetical protein
MAAVLPRGFEHWSGPPPEQAEVSKLSGAQREMPAAYEPAASGDLATTLDGTHRAAGYRSAARSGTHAGTTGLRRHGNSRTSKTNTRVDEWNSRDFSGSCF